MLVIAVFFFSFVVWAVSKCGDTKAKYQAEAAAGQTVPIDTPAAAPAPVPLPQRQPVASDQAVSGGVASGTIAPATPDPTTTTPGATAAINTPVAAPQGLTRLYIVVKDVNLREKPATDGKLVAKLPIFEEVYYLNQVTDFTQKLSIGTETADEPWVKVRTKKGREGWVYGAYVSYIKKKRKGAW